ncbi:MAG: hypothetical protein FJY74_07910 [Candidatus Eisenbacteria bacterium]|nr:hypothetical protein [Candidatus Eisenbacteria bacterium]
MATRLATVVALAMCLLVCGCILSPRDPDGPPDGGATNWETPITTLIVLQNLAAAMDRESSSNYRDCFTEDYRFHVDPQDSLDAGQEAEQMFADWTRADEEYATSRIFVDAAEISVAFTTVLQPDETQPETCRQVDYTLAVTWQSGPHVNEEIIYRGRASLWMRRSDSGRWAIFRWVDRRMGGTNRTWGALRGDYRG